MPAYGPTSITKPSQVCPLTARPDPTSRFWADLGPSLKGKNRTGESCRRIRLTRHAFLPRSARGPARGLGSPSWLGVGSYFFASLGSHVAQQTARPLNQRQDPCPLCAERGTPAALQRCSVALLHCGGSMDVAWTGQDREPHAHLPVIFFWTGLLHTATAPQKLEPNPHFKFHSFRIQLEGLCEPAGPPPTRATQAVRVGEKKRKKRKKTTFPTAWICRDLGTQSSSAQANYQPTYLPTRNTLAVGNRLLQSELQSTVAHRPVT